MLASTLPIKAQGGLPFECVSRYLASRPVIPSQHWKPTMKILIASALILFTSLASAQVLEVNLWKPNPGGADATMAAAKEAEAIIDKMGGNAQVGLDLDGTLHFVTFHDNWAGWATQNQKLEKNQEWTAFIAKWSAAPSAVLIENYLLNTPVSGGEGDVYQVFIWEPELGRGSDLLKAAVEAKAIHEKDGASITIHLDQMNHMHYVMNFASWDAWAAFQDAEHPEFQAFMEKQNADPTGRLIKVYTASNQ